MSDASMLMRRAAAEIRDLRRRLELAEAKLSGIHLAAMFLRATTPPPEPLGMAEDMAWRLDREASALEVAESVEASRHDDDDK